jgi:hypothetical protein
MQVMIRKASGELEEFNPEKVRTAVIRSGAPLDTADEIVKHVSRRVKKGMSTREIYKITFRLLKKEKHSLASRYDLKHAIMRLGPAGFPFETYVGEILREHGHSIQLRQMIQGKCVEHEIDVILDGDTLVECKYHNMPGIYTGLKPTMYTYARFLDLRNNAREKKSGEFTGVWLATNTKFSSEAKEYAECIGINLLGWRHPKENSLEQMIESRGLYPITILQSIDTVSKNCFSNAEMMLIKDLIELDPVKIKVKTGIPITKLSRIIQEAKGILNRDLH